MDAQSAGRRKPNRLAGETSPYLRQHAYNPVDWRPWGEEALAAARADEKPIFLSIGYAACHWCHVMERESFADDHVAAFLNQHFVPIKVDREERPDLDSVYMGAVQALTGHGGWPMSMFLTPDGRPFYGGTYFPPERRFGMPSFLELLQAVAEAWATRRGELEHGAAELAARLAEHGPGATGPVDLDAATRAAVDHLALAYDRRHGGFGGAPKFPTPSRLFFLLRRARRGDRLAAGMLAATLDGMAAGGMYDWAGGGFHRYSVDAEWLVPHFEKMLYDNALLARAYGEAGVRLGNDGWTGVALETARYLVREMQGPEGGFYSSTDADSEGEEGLYFTWTAEEVRAALGDDADLVVRLCGLDGDAGLEHGRSVLRLRTPLAVLARELGRPEAEAAARLARGREALLAARSRRVPPACDDKRLAGWNGMAAWALAWLGAALEAGDLLAAAQRAGAFLVDTLIGADGRIARSWRDRSASGAETLEDVAWVAAGLVELYQADGDVRWLAAALRVADARLPRYLDTGGRAFEAPDDGEALFMRARNPLDGATPASAGVLASALARLAAITGRDDLATAAARIVGAESDAIARFPEGAAALLDAALDLAAPPTSVVVVGDPAWPATAALLRTARRLAPAGAVVVPAPAVPVPAPVVAAVPLFAGRERAGDGAALAYLCTGGACLRPTADPAELAAALAPSVDSRGLAR